MSPTGQKWKNGSHKYLAKPSMNGHFFPQLWPPSQLVDNSWENCTTGNFSPFFRVDSPVTVSYRIGTFERRKKIVEEKVEITNPRFMEGEGDGGHPPFGNRPIYFLFFLWRLPLYTPEIPFKITMRVNITLWMIQVAFYENLSCIVEFSC